MSKIVNVQGREILDSRGNPTIEVLVTLESGTEGVAMVPSGASTGAHEAIELRDGDKARYNGKGVLNAVAHVNTELKEAVIGMEASDQKALDDAMIALDGTENKGRLGANAILGISLATARASALEQSIPLYAHINTLLHTDKKVALPVPMFNVLNGGMHSDSGLSFQEFMLVPTGIATYSEQLRAGSEIFHALKKLLEAKGFVTSVGDEGGFAPRLTSHDEAFEYLIKAIETAGYVPGEQVSIALDTASTSFYDTGLNQYLLKPENKNLSTEAMIALYESWIQKYHLVSIEDGLQEDDWTGWATMKETLESKKRFVFASHPEKLETAFMLVGDDLLVTNPKRLQQAIEGKSCNAILIKVNQIGTLSETLECIRLAQTHDIRVVVSHRSGETVDDFIADLAVGTGAECIKTGSLSRGERLAKYNRLLAIESEISNP
ncbi:phosphopyruvate hydratase [Candidatus Kaiserbacteria bacterium]|nr:MAG: phosphopyruvate hydratase [Candidatus Kaiserbacteria bacterium]